MILLPALVIVVVHPANKLPTMPAARRFNALPVLLPYRTAERPVNPADVVYAVVVAGRPWTQYAGVKFQTKIL